MSTSSKMHPAAVAALVVGGVVLAAGVAAAVWAFFTPQHEEDPLEEADRIIGRIEDSITRLNEMIPHVSQS